LQARDARDKSRSIAPLKPASDAVNLDNSQLSIEESMLLLLKWFDERRVQEQEIAG
jgi:3-phosphoshikimate 1-carboxyvinyltransferase